MSRSWSAADAVSVLGGALKKKKSAGKVGVESNKVGGTCRPEKTQRRNEVGGEVGRKLRVYFVYESVRSCQTPESNGYLLV